MNASRRTTRWWVRGVTGALLTALGLSGCSLGKAIEGDAVLVGATNFTESRILANMYALAIQHTGAGAQVKELSTREINEPALEKNQLQVTPEYLGTFTEYLNAKTNGPKAPQVASGDVATTYAAAVKLATPRNLTVLPPSPAADSNAFAVTAEFAAKHRVKTLTELAAYSQQTPIVLGAGPDCPTRLFCQPGLEQVYGIKFAKFVSLDAGGPLTIQALDQNKIDLALVFSSQGTINSHSLVVLDDDLRLEVADNIIPVLNTAAVTPAISEALNAISKALTTNDLRTMNSAVDTQRQDPKIVAQTWLRSKGLI